MHSHDRTLLAKLGFADPDRKSPWHDVACQYVLQETTAREILVNITKTRSDWLTNIKGDPEHHITKGYGQYCTTIGFCDALLSFGRFFLSASCRREYTQGKAEKWLKEQREIAQEDYESRSWEWWCGRSPSLIEELADEVKKGIRENWARNMVLRDAIRKTMERVTKTLRVSADQWVEECVAEPPRFRWVDSKTGWIDESCGLELPHISQQCLVEVKIQPVSVGDILRQLELYRQYLPVDYTVVVTAYDLSTEDVGTLNQKGVHHVRLGQGFEHYGRRREVEHTTANSLQI